MVALAFDQLQALDLVGPLEVFSAASRLLEAGGAEASGYRIEVVGPSRSTRASSGLMLQVAPLEAARGAIDTLLIPGGAGVRAALEAPAVTRWVERAARRSRRVVSVCTGAFLLAEAGLLDGRRAATHWSATTDLATRYPAVDVDPASIFVKDGTLATSAGVTSGIDLALALVEDDHGAALALEVARWLVLYLRRPGDQSQFSRHLAAQAAEEIPDDRLRTLQRWIAAHPDADLSVPALAGRVAVSPRTLARLFWRHLQTTPGDYVEGVRLHAARDLLETTERPMAEIARTCGFGTVETFYRSFQRRLHTTPVDYRRRFSAVARQYPA